MKRIFYILCAMFLGFLLSMLAHALLEMWYIGSSLASGVAPEARGVLGHSCFLPGIVQVGLPIAGIVGGMFVGSYWWRVVYIEKLHWRYHFGRKKDLNG